MTMTQCRFFDFGDKRLNDRARKCFSTLLSGNCCEGFPRIFGNQYDLKAFYRLMNNERVNPEKFVQGYVQGLEQIRKQQASSSAQPKTYYQYQDSTYGSFLNRNKLDLGYLENPTDNGLVIHTSILTDSVFIPLGIPWQRQIIRDRAKYQKARNRKKRPFEEKESFKWVEALDWSISVQEQLDIRIIHVTDREGDMNELFNYVFENELDIIIRARHDRILPEQEEKLWAYLRSQPAKATIKRQLLDSKGQTYEAQCAVFWTTIQLKDVTEPIQVVYLRQLDQLDKVKQGAEWAIYTTLPVKNKPQSIGIVDVYTKRWRTCEDFHKCLKSGCSMEKRQFDSAHGMTNTIAMLSLVAMHLVRMRHLASLGNQPVNQVIDEQQCKLAEVLADKYLKPVDLTHCKPKTVLWLVLLLGRMGGHQGIRQKGLPGWKTLWLGWYDFRKLMDGIILSKNFL